MRYGGWASVNNWKGSQSVAELAIVVLLLSACAPRGSLSPSLAFVEAHKDGLGGVDGLRGIWSMAISPDGRHLYAAGYRDGAVALFSRDATTGRLTYVGRTKDGVGGVEDTGSPCSVAVSPDGKHVYVASHWDHAVVVFSRDRITGELTFVEAQQDGVGGVDGLYVSQWVTVSPDGRHVYAAGYRDYALAVFIRNEATGKLTFVEVQRDGINGVDGLYGVSSVAVSPDGEYVYTTAYFDGTLAVFRRDDATGRLSFLEVQRDGVTGVEGLRGAYSVAPSPDGKHVYVAGGGDHAVAVFSQDSATGELTFVEVQQDDVGGVDGLQVALSVAVSPDGRYVYVAGRGEHALAMFSRDEKTGNLMFVESLRDGLGGVDGLQGASFVAVSPDRNGQHVYVAGNCEQAIAVFAVREP
jgi:6-phosphogluconolactonase (cycloisomerase 2 family)